MKQAGQHAFFKQLVKLVLDDNFPFDSIAFIIFSEYIAWLSLPTTSKMRYSQASKEFWWTGMKWFGGKFIRYMQGFKHKGSFIHGTAEKGKYDPLLSKVNFAVPSESILSSFSPIESLQSVNGDIGPGIVSPLLKRNTEHNVNKSHVLSFDGKKIVPNSVEIDLFGCGDATAQHQIHLSFGNRLYFLILENEFLILENEFLMLESEFLIF